MGSEKYPAENGFDAFLKKHGGSDNASTDCERTIFQFDVQRKFFRDALDRWAGLGDLATRGRPSLTLSPSVCPGGLSSSSAL